MVNKVTAQSRHTNGSEIPTEMSLSTESKLRKITLCVGRKIDFLRSLQKGKDKKNNLWCQWCFVCEYFQHFSCSSKGCQPQDLHARDSGRKGSTTQQRAAELKSGFWPVTPEVHQQKMEAKFQPKWPLRACFVLRSHSISQPFYCAVQVRSDSVTWTQLMSPLTKHKWRCFIIQETSSKSAACSKSWGKIKHSLCGDGGGKVFHNTSFPSLPIITPA